MASLAVRDPVGDHLQAGGRPIGWVSLAAELQRDLARDETAEGVVEIVLTERLLKA
jgi:hypothetical protein